MKFFDRLGLALFSIIVLVLAIILCLIGFGWMEPTIFSILIGKVLISQTYTYVMIGVCIVFMLLAVRCLFFSDTSKKEVNDDGILLQNEDGRLLITVETLKNMVEGVINEFSNITDSSTNVMITKNNDIIIESSLDVTKNTIIKETTSKLQSKIKKVIKDATDLDIKYVNVRIRNAEIILNPNTPKKVEEVSKKEETPKAEVEKETAKPKAQAKNNKAKK